MSSVPVASVSPATGDAATPATTASPTATTTRLRPSLVITRESVRPYHGTSKSHGRLGSRLARAEADREADLRAGRERLAPRRVLPNHDAGQVVGVLADDVAQRAVRLLDRTGRAAELLP